MSKDMFVLQVPLLEKILRTVLVYSLILLLVRWVLEGRPTTVIEHGRVVERALDKLGVRTSELDHAIRSQHGDDLDEIDHGELTPSGQFVLTLKTGEQSSTKVDIAELAERLQHIEDLLATRH